ncbi:hypothetical protein Tco_1432596, partial [Tanacetum coccineum]
MRKLVVVAARCGGGRWFRSEDGEGGDVVASVGDGGGDNGGSVVMVYGGVRHRGGREMVLVCGDHRRNLAEISPKSGQKKGGPERGGGRRC